MKKFLSSAAVLALLLGTAACSHSMRDNSSGSSNTGPSSSGMSGSSTSTSGSSMSQPYGANAGAEPGSGPYHSPTVTDMTGHTEAAPGNDTSKSGTTTQGLGVKAPGAPNSSGGGS